MQYPYGYIPKYEIKATDKFKRGRIVIKIKNPGKYDLVEYKQTSHDDFIFGIGYHAYPGHKEDHIDLDFAAMRDAGVEYVRFDFWWMLINPEPDTYDFSFFDRLVSSARANDLKIIGVLATMPPIFQTDYNQDSCAEYVKAYISKVVGRYKDVVHDWQILNEIDYPYYQRGARFDQLSGIIDAVGATIKQIDPDARVSTNICIAPDVIYRLLHTNGGRWLDYIGLDNYPGSWSPGGPETLSWFASFAQSTGIQLPFCFMEFGYPSGGMGWAYSYKGDHNEGIQAEYLKESYDILVNAPNIMGAVFFSYNNEDYPGTPEEERHWGIVDQERNKKPGYFAYKEIVEKYSTIGKIDIQKDETIITIDDCRAGDYNLDFYNGSNNNIKTHVYAEQTTYVEVA